MFRLAGPDDCDELLDIYTPYIRDTTITFETVVPTAAEFRCRITGIGEFYPHIVHSRDDGGLDGYAYASAFNERGGYRYDVSVSVYLRPEARGRGLGRALYDRLFPILRLQGLRIAYAGITQPNPASNRLHEASGFVPVGLYRNSGRKHGRWLDVLWMEKPLLPFDDNPPPPAGIASIPESALAEILA